MKTSHRRNFVTWLLNSMSDNQYVNVSRALENWLQVELGLDALRAFEVSCEWAPTIAVDVQSECSRLSEMGVDGVLYPGQRTEDFLTPGHVSYKGALGPGFNALRKAIQAADAKDFNGWVALALYVMGASSLLITDGANDGGVDVLATFAHVPGTAVCVQSKAWAGPLTPNELYTEAGKLRSEGFSAYERQVGGSPGGRSVTNVIVSQAGFTSTAISKANELRVLVRSTWEVSATILRGLDADTALGMIALGRPYKRDLRKDLVAFWNHSMQVH